MMNHHESSSPSPPPQDAHHILLDGKVEYELEELSRILLVHEQYQLVESSSSLREKLEWWEEAKFLKEQGFLFPSSSITFQQQLTMEELEELKFECEDDVLPKYLLPLSSSRRDLEIILNQLMNCIEKDPVVREWIVEKSLHLLNTRGNQAEIKHLLAYFPIILQNVFEFKQVDLRAKTKDENSEEVEIVIDPRVEENIMKSVLFSLKDRLDQKHVIIDLCFAFLYLRSKEYEKAEICLVHVTNESELLDNGMSYAVWNNYHLLKDLIRSNSQLFKIAFGTCSEN